MARQKIVVVGAGVSGLTTAMCLSRNADYSITVTARHMPGDYDIEYASPWAGANYMPMSKHDTNAKDYEHDTWSLFEDLARHHADAGVHFQLMELHQRTKDVGSQVDNQFSELFSSDPWWRDLFPDFSEMPKEDLPAGTARVTRATSVCINTAIYLPWLVSQCLKNGVVFKRATFKHIADAASPGVHSSGEKADVIINCTGLSAAKLGGVEDQNMIPARGQIVVVRNDAGCMYSSSGTDDPDDEVMYIMTRAAGGGTVLGGCYQLGNWESQPDPSLAMRIMKRCVEICPQLTGGKGIEHLDIIRHSVGLRPVRKGGIRLEAEVVDGIYVVHNYGHGGYGYQTSYGCSERVLKLVEEKVSTDAGRNLYQV